jgi:hypothetical protein
MCLLTIHHGAFIILLHGHIMGFAAFPRARLVCFMLLDTDYRAGSDVATRAFVFRGLLMAYLTSCGIYINRRRWWGWQSSKVVDGNTRRSHDWATKKVWLIQQAQEKERKKNLQLSGNPLPHPKLFKSRSWRIFKSRGLDTSFFHSSSLYPPPALYIKRQRGPLTTTNKR